MNNTLLFVGRIIIIIIILILTYLTFKYLIYNRIAFLSTNIQFEPFKLNDYPTTEYERAVANVFGNPSIMHCNLLATTSDTDCVVDNIQIIKKKFPVHLLKLPNQLGNILAVFNDGRLYEKDNIASNMWRGPLKHSMPNDLFPLRMITISPNGLDLLGVAYNNKLYTKKLSGYLDSEWKIVPNNNDIIYALSDPETYKLITITTAGKLQIKDTDDILSDNKPITTNLPPILKVYFDNNGYMLAITNKFKLIQFADRNWKTSLLNMEKGANKSLVHDIIYDNDAKLYGLIFVSGMGVLELMKQEQIYYLSDFIPFEFHLDLDNKNSYVLTDSDIVKFKTGVDLAKQDILRLDTEQSQYNNPEFAYNRQLLENKKKLRDFCANRMGAVEQTEFNNYEVLAKIEDNENRIAKLKTVIADIKDI